MNRKQLENLKGFVNNNFPNKLVAFDYYNKEYQCNCIIGSMLPLVGGQLDENYKNSDDGETEYFNRFKTSKGVYFQRLYKKFIEYFGMEEMEITELQGCNDSYECNGGHEKEMTLRAERIKLWLEEYIIKKEREISE